MSESYLDGLLDELVPTDVQDGWEDVRHRARRSQRRWGVLVAVVAILVLAPATWAAWKTFEGTPAPPSVRRTFGNYNAWARQFAKRWPRAEARKAHGVLRVNTKDGPYALWVAPASTGGVCFIGALERDGRPVVSRGWRANCLDRKWLRHAPAFILGASPTDGGSYEDGSAKRGVLYGYANRPVATIEVTWPDGRKITLPVVEHFFLLPMSSLYAHLSFTGRDSNGRVVIAHVRG